MGGAVREPAPREAKAVTVLVSILNAYGVVVLFFMLSGYVLSLSLASAGRLGPEIPGYLVRRAFRLFPPLWISLLVFAAVTNLVPYADPSGQASAAVSGQVRHGKGVGDPRYLLAEIQELKAIAEKGGFGTLSYLLECAAIEARAQVQQAEESRDGTG